MPELVNYTPFPNIRYYSKDSDRREFGVIVVKGTFALSPSGQLMIAEEQAPMVFTDLCHGAVNLTSLWHPSDLVPVKPATDVIVNAVARVPNGRTKRFWECSIAIESSGTTRVEKALRVTGPRHWQPRWRRELGNGERAEWQKHRRAFDRWELSEPEPIGELPLHYEYAYGGEIPQGVDDDGNPVFDTDHRNPLGRGKIDPEWTDHTAGVPAPQIEDPRAAVTDPYAQLRPESFGPIPPAWLPRRPLGGTYDQNWKDNVWPAWPKDYDTAYHNSAHPDLIVSPFLRGTERIVLTGLSAAAETVAFDLPKEVCFVDLVPEDGELEQRFMNLDTVFLDIAARNPDDWRILLSWRLNFEPDLYVQARINRAAIGMARNTTLDQDRSAA
ncbi:DUF2169 domain-containing protein [Rhizobium sp. P44RR-XXIV]|uniref:DUF2169 family type VI secretion system accessory protein n=1 Tax=Rhizobium sp. P44RR-XXIV TaxID=1921145 RepID=UPI0009C81AAE|nr:DUF2169 domain-containing protein [Rhizobium sp. P44RR-XXIV]